MSRDADSWVRRQATRYRASESLRTRIALDIARQSADIRPPAAPRRWFAARWLQAGAAFALGLLCAVALLPVLQAPNPGGADLASELVADHKRSLMADHLTDVASTDRHAVKPWFQGKLGFSPPVFDFAAQGFALAGGRLDMVAGRPAAALVYRHGGHVINVFVWPAGAGAPDRSAARDGFNAIALQAEAMQLGFVSDVDAAQLRIFAGMWRDAATAASRPAAPGLAQRR